MHVVNPHSTLLGRDLDLIDEHCPRLEPADWDGREHFWDGQRFLRERLWFLASVPLNLGRVIRRTWGRAAHASRRGDIIMILTRTRTPLTGEALFNVRDPPAGAALESVSGTYYSRQWKGGYRDIKNMIRWTREDVAERYGAKPTDVLTWASTCPRCAPKNGGISVVVFARVPDGAAA